MILALAEAERNIKTVVEGISSCLLYKYLSSLVSAKKNKSQLPPAFHRLSLFRCPFSLFQL